MHYFSLNFLLFLLIQVFSANCCIEHERDALLEFKNSVKDYDNDLASWRGEECCNWTGIRCRNRTGHVVKLNLRNTNFDLIELNGDISYWTYPPLTGKISPSLLHLSDLKYLDLSYNNFSGNIFPNFIAEFRNLRYLNLSHTALSGMIPPQLGNLSKLLYLDLSHDIFSDFILNTDTWWLSNLKSLKHMDMSGVDFKDSNDWVETLSKLSLLEVLVLSHNNLTQIPNAPTFVNFTSLRVLHLSYQNFNAPIPNWVGNLTSLNKLELNHNSLHGMVPPLHSLTKLTHLSLPENNIEGDISELFLGKLSNYTLVNLNLSHNHLIGNIPFEIGNMTSLESLDLHMNNLSGTIPQSISALYFLAVLNFSYNNLSGRIPYVYQLKTFNDPSIYSGNPYLCGPPLETSCVSVRYPQSDGNNKSNLKTTDDVGMWLYLFIEFGFVTGFLVMFFILMFKLKWRYTYFQIVDSAFDRLYVIGILTFKWLMKEPI